MTDVEKWLQNIKRVERINKDKRQETIMYKKAYTGDFSYTKDSQVGKYTLKVNFIYYFIETILPAIFSGDPKIRIKPKRDPSLEPAAKLFEYNTNYWARELNAKDEIKDCLFDSFFGPTAAYTGWEYETQIIEDKQQKFDEIGNPMFKDGQPVMEKVEKEIVLRDRPKVKWLDFWEEVRVDPDVKRTRQARWMAVRITVPYEEFILTENIKKEYRDPKSSKKIKPTMRPEDLARDELDAISNTRENNKSDPEWVTYWEVWDREKMERKFVHESVKDDYLNEDMSWPFEFQFKDDPFPVTIYHAKQDPFSNMSFSEFKPIEDHIWERVRLRSVQAAIVRRFAPKYVYPKTAATKEQMKKFLTSDILSANELNNPALLQLAPIPDLPPAFFQWDGVMEQDLGNVSGLSEFERMRLANTATEASIAEGRSNVRKDARTQEFEDFVVTVLGKMAMLCQQLQNRENIMLIDGLEMGQQHQKIFGITKENIQGEYDFDMISGTMSHDNEALELQHLQRFYEISLNGQDPEVNHRYLIEKIAEYMGLDVKQALLTMEQKQVKAAAAAQAQAAQAAAAAAHEKPLITMKPIDLNEIPNPEDKIRIVEAMKAQNHVPNLTPGPLQSAQGQLQQLNQMGQNGMGQSPGIPVPGPMPQIPGGPPRPQGIPTTMPMNATTNMAGRPNPVTPVHPASMEGKR